MPETFNLYSAGFHSGEPIPPEYTCDGVNTSPALRWSGAPEGTRAFALIVDDPDAPGKTFVHWVLYNLPGGTSQLPAEVDIEDEFGGAASEGANDFGGQGYGGPCPPPDHGEHHYHFRLYALDAELDLGPGATKQQLTDAMDGHILAETDLIGTYQRGTA